MKSVIVQVHVADSSFGRKRTIVKVMLRLRPRPCGAARIIVSSRRTAQCFHPRRKIDIYLSALFSTKVEREGPLTAPTRRSAADKSEPQALFIAFAMTCKATSRRYNDTRPRIRTNRFAMRLSPGLSRFPELGRKPLAAAAGAGRNVWQTAFFVLAGIGLLSAVLIYATSSRKTDVTAAMQVEETGLPVQPIGPATGAQEESLAKLPAMTEAEILAATMGQR